jgi:glycosyltransferase involved in cell wall biosynthesis
MKRKIKVLEAVNILGLGGTEYALQLYSKYFDKNIFDVTVVAIKTGGVRVKLIEDLGIEVKVLDENYTALAEILKETDVVHWHGNGTIADNYQFFETLKKHRPQLVIQTNVFGLFDNHSWYGELIDYDLYISEMILVRRMSEDKNLPSAYIEKRKILAYPVDIDVLRSLLPSEKAIEDFKVRHSLNNCFVVGRLGRAHDAKFDRIALDGFKEFLKANPMSKFLINGVTPKMRRHVARLGITKSIVEVPNTSDLEELMLLYSAMDVFLACSSIGESFGMVMAEAMSVGTPVVTINTPERDNAQIEVVENNLTGIVTHPLKRTIGESLYKISKDEELKKRFSEESIAKVKNYYDAKKIVASLESLILQHFNHPEITPGESLLINWSNKVVDDYNLRLKDVEGDINFLGELELKIKRNKLYRKIKLKLFGF